MTFEEFVSRYQKLPLVDSSAFAVTSPKPNQLRLQVHHWQKKGYIHALKRGVYLLDEKYRKADVSPLFVANYLVSPSYLSLEFALSHYALIPEQAHLFTSVTTKRTRQFENVLGLFTYQTVKKSLFLGYEPIQTDAHECLIATPEKALLDYFYLNSGDLEVSNEQVESLRLQNLDSLDLGQLLRYAVPFTLKVQRLAKVVADMADSQNRRQDL